MSCTLVADVADKFGEVRLRVTGASMVPAIWPGDTLTVRRVSPLELRPGQIVLYRRQENLVAHRITRIGTDRLITKGDTMLRDDPPVDAADIVGTVDGIERNGRRVPSQQTLWRIAASSILRRSDFCLRIALRLRRLLSWPADAVTAPTS